MPTLLTTKQKKESQLKHLWRDFRVWRSDVQMAWHSYNLQTTLLTQIGVTQSRTWKQLILQGERAEEIVTRVSQEDNKSL